MNRRVAWQCDPSHLGGTSDVLLRPAILELGGRAKSVTIRINQETADLVQRKVDQGLHPDLETAFAEADRLLDEQDDLATLRAKLQVGLDEMERGDVIRWNEETKLRIIREGEEAYERADLIDPDVHS